MKYKHCPDCGTQMVHRRSTDGWTEDYGCWKCKLSIHIDFGEPMHAAGDKEKWTRVPEPYKPKEFWIHKHSESGAHISEVPHGGWLHVREVIE